MRYISNRYLNGFFVTALAASFVLSSCVTGRGGGSSKPKKSKKKYSSVSDRNNQVDDGYVSSSRKTLINSMSNNRMTSHTISSSKANGQVSSLRGNAKDKSKLEGLLSAQRIARKPMSMVQGTAKKILAIELSKSLKRGLNDAVKLDLALAAINNKRFGFAEYYLQDVIKSKHAKIRAAAHNAIGVIALRDKRIPEAVLSFRAALKASSSYRPALLNLGFTALKGGDLGTAKKALRSMQNDWFVRYGLISIARLEGDVGKADSLCRDVLSKKAKHKATLFNCALHEFQSKKNYSKAKSLLGRMQGERGGSAEWDVKAHQLSRQISAAARAGGGARKKPSGSKKK